MVSFTEIKLGDLATWISGLGAVGVLYIALKQIKVEQNRNYKAREEKRKYEIRKQAESISAWIDSEFPHQGFSFESKSEVIIAISNNSADPIYDVILSVVSFHGGSTRNKSSIPIDRRCLRIVPPGKGKINSSGGYQEASLTPAVEVAFTDKNGRHWLRRTNGSLRILKRTPLALYALNEQTVKWELPGQSYSES